MNLGRFVRSIASAIDWPVLIAATLIVVVPTAIVGVLLYG
jgi:hypothetical protein